MIATENNRKAPSALSVEQSTLLVHNNNKKKNSCNPNKHKIRYTLIACIILIGLFIFCASIFGIWPFKDDKNNNISFDPTTATINSIIVAITKQHNPISCSYIINSYIDRIDKYDKEKHINSIISLNPFLLKQAQELDNFYRNNSSVKGKLHCVPLLIKDNIDVSNLTTSGGIYIFNNNTTKAIQNAYIMNKLINEGAILIGKTNMAPLSTDSYTTKSDIVGECHNPYSNHNRTCYGSSGGTAAAIASSFAVIGLGTDTVGSITLPCSGSNLFGVRTAQSVSMQGIMPSFRYSEVVGPMTKTIIDSAIIMDILMDKNKSNGYSTDKVLNLSKYENLTFGIMGAMWAKIVNINTPYEYTVSDNVFEIQNEIISNLKNVNLVNITLTESQENTLLTSVNYADECANGCYSDDWEKYLFFHGNYSTVEWLIHNANTPDWFANRLNNSLLFDCNSSCIYYFNQRQVLRNVFDEIYDEYGLDIIVFPGTPISAFKLNGTYQEEDIGWSGVGGIWPAYIGYPAINVPVQFTPPIRINNDAVLGLPTGMLLMSKIQELHKLFTAAYGYQQLYGYSRTKLPLF
eukprot:449859_1